MFENLTDEQFLLLLLAFLGFIVFSIIGWRISRSQNGHQKPQRKKRDSNPPQDSEIETRLTAIEKELPKIYSDIEDLRIFKTMCPQPKQEEEKKPDE